MKKVKRLTAVILSALMMTSAFSVLPVSAAEVESNTSAVSSDENFISGDYEYSLLDNGTVEISKYIGSDKEITIPDTIDGKKVTSINNLVFEHCIGLESITIPENITNIENMAFRFCTNLESINVDVNNNIYSSIDGVLFNKEQDKIIFFPYNKSDSYEIPDSVTSIGALVFCDCSSLESVTIPNSVTSIGAWAFCACSSLESVTIPNSVTNIDIGAFCACSSLESITIPNSVTNIGESAFESCSSLESITIPNRVTRIDDSTFWGCSSLESITIPNSVTSIGESAFENCENLKSVYLPNKNFEIGEQAFGYNIHSVLVEGFEIYGYEDTSAEEYARANNITFISITDKTLTDTDNNIIVSGAMQENTSLNVSKIENTYENSVATYDITLQKDGAVIQPDGTITVQIPSNAENCKVMWLKDDGTAEDMNAKYTDGCYVFTTDHLSVYALVQDKTILTGDANQDGIIDVNDVTYLQMHIAGNKNTDGSALIDETNKQLFNCVDMNKDGKLSVSDVTELQIYISNNNPKIN